MAYDLREQISQQLIDAISNGIEPWKRPWRASKNAGAQPTSNRAVATRA